MKVFISWSGVRSRRLAIAFRDWLPDIISGIEPFVSSEDIYAGSRWQAEIAGKLEESTFGIVCVTADNQHSPWLNFEAGALGKTVTASRVIPVSLDLDPSGIEMPLGQFQAVSATQAGVRQLLESINSVYETPLSDARLEKAARIWWPELEPALDQIRHEAAPGENASVSVRTERDLLEEVLNTLRALAREMRSGSDRAAAGAADETFRDIAMLLNVDFQFDFEPPDHVTVRTEMPPDMDTLRRLRAIAARRGMVLRVAETRPHDDMDADE
jgi:hypothetical protein